MNVLPWLSLIPFVPFGDLPEKIEKQEAFLAQLNETQAVRKELLASYSDHLPYNKACWLTAHNAFATKADVDGIWRGGPY